MVCFVANMGVILYLTLWLPLVLKITIPWEIYCPHLIPISTALGVLSVLLLTIAFWPIFGLLSPLIIVILLMGFLFSSHFIPWPCWWYSRNILIKIIFLLFSVCNSDYFQKIERFYSIFLGQFWYRILFCTVYWKIHIKVYIWNSKSSSFTSVFVHMYYLKLPLFIIRGLKGQIIFLFLDYFLEFFFLFRLLSSQRCSVCSIKEYSIKEWSAALTNFLLFIQNMIYWLILFFV